MKKENKKYFIYLSTIILLLTIITTTTIIAGELTLTTYSPFESVASNNSVTYSDKLTAIEVTTIEPNIATTKFDEIDDYDELDIITSPYCQVGGQYYAKVKNEIKQVNSLPTEGMYDTINLTYETSFNIFYCYTTKDFMEEINIPSSWAGSNMLIYCNDGSNINVQNSNFDLFTTKVNNYKSCIIKNLDLNDQNTLLYGMEVGNDTIDDDSIYFYDTLTKTSPVLVEMEYVSDNIYKDKEDREFYFNHDNDTKIFVMSDFESDLSFPISSIFDLDELEISRVAFLKKIGNKKIIGYETITKNITNIIEYNESLKTLYTIKLEGFNFQSGECEDVLAQYKTITSSTIMKNDDISCTGDTIQIISESLDSSSQTTSSSTTTNTSTTSSSSSTSFHVFKNIILSLE